MAKKKYRDNHGNEVVLHRCLGVGGEGAVFEIAGQLDRVAKIYSQAVLPDKVDKLAGMASIATSDLLKFAAWPKATLHDCGTGALKGFVMPRIKGARAIHELYSPAQRKLHFPRADWRFMIRTARNCAAAFATLHEYGIIVGDVNQGNVFVSPRALATLIDCDSFQIAVNGRIHRCRVGVPHFTPPELLSLNDFERVDRTRNHDSFGLALLIFHLLFMGRHPFAGSYAGQQDMPIEEAIRQKLFAYAESARRQGMYPPPHSLTLRDISTDTAQMFERAFCSRNRPTPQEWVKTLSRLEDRLCKCQDDPGHVYPAQLPSCPWCRIVGSGGPNFFISVTVAALVGYDVRTADELWAEIERLPFPSESLGPLPSVRASQIKPKPIPATLFEPPLQRLLKGLGSEEPDDDTGFQSAVGWTAAIAAVVTLFAVVIPPLAMFSAPIALVFFVWWLGFVIPPRIRRLLEERRLQRIRAERQRELDRIRLARQAALRSAEEEFEQAQRNFQSVAKQYDDRFREKVASLRQLKDKLDSLEHQRNAELQKLQENARQAQLEEYLRQFLIRDANIAGIPGSLIPQLASYGIETAFDVSEYGVRQVPGFGEVRTGRLIAWRHQKERGFRFNPSKPIPQADRQAVEVKYQQQRIHYVRLLRQGPFELRQITSTTKAETHRIREEIASRQRAVTQAKADLAYLNEQAARLGGWGRTK